MINKQVQSALEELHKELNNLAPAIEHIHTAQQVTQTVKQIPNKHIELINDLKDLFTEELKGITTENKNISKTTSELQTEVKKELEDLSMLRQTVAAFHEKVIIINFPERLDKLDANVAGIMAAIQSTQSRLDNIERNLSDKMKDLSDRQKEEMQSMKNFMDASAKKQQTNNYITWALIVLGIVAIIMLCKK